MKEITAPPGSRLPWVAANATVFVASGCVMVIELVAGRIVSRHLGSSIYTWTSVIGVVLAGLAIGNYVGGRLADRFRPAAALCVLFLLSSATCVAIIVGNNLVGEWTLLWDLAWPLRVALHVALVFCLPAALMGTISPVVARRALDLGRRTGRTLGSVYAWGVVGSLVGTFLTGYVLIDRFGTGAIIWSVAGTLAGIGILHAPRAPGGWGWAGVLLASCALANAPGGWARGPGEQLALREPADPEVIYRDESLYSHIEVRRVSANPDVRALFLDKLMHSQVTIGAPAELHYGYTRIFAELTRLKADRRGRLRALTIGGGGYVFSRYLEVTWPQSSIEVVEIDPAVTRAAQAAFGLPSDTGIVTHHADGRVFVNRLLERRARGERVPSYDFVYVDAVNDYSVPFQLTTLEFFEGTAELLAPDGMLLVNAIDVLDDGRFVGALARTLGQVFPELAVYTLEGYEQMRGDSRLTFVLAAARRPWRRDDLAGAERLPDARVERWRDPNAGPVLTDAFAPVENLLASVVRASARDVAASDALVLARRSDERGDTEGCARYCRVALHMDPRFVEAHYYLAVASYRLGRTDEALEHWRRAIALRPGYVEALYDLGAALYARGELDAAWRHLSEALRLRPDMAAAHVAVGIVHEARGELDEAEREYRQALRLDPALEEARGHLERIRLRRELAGRERPGHPVPERS